VSVIFAFPGHEKFVNRMREQADFSLGEFKIKNFPDGESLVTLKTDVKDKNVTVVCGLNDVDSKILPLIFFVHVAREMGAKSVELIAPYLGYMRQDKRFNPGEAITSEIFAKLLSSLVDCLVTVDPHLHRHKSLYDIYTIPNIVLHAAAQIGEWINQNIENPIIIGPDEESKQWVKDVAERAQAQFIVLKKIRHGDKKVEISSPDIEKYKNHTPVLVDDMISTARTMIEAIKKLREANMKAPVCVGIHAIFAGDAYEKLKNSGVEKIVTTNTIFHESNQIDVASLFAKALKGVERYV
jgi:ribose-phosphate pyrophosphokinase